MGITQQQVPWVAYDGNGVAFAQTTALGGGYTRLIILGYYER